MNPEGPLVAQSNILPEFNFQTVGSKGVRVNLPQKNQIASGVFVRNASAIVKHCVKYVLGVNDVIEHVN